MIPGSTGDSVNANLSLRITGSVRPGRYHGPMKIRALFKPVRRLLACKSVRHVAVVCAVFALVIGGGAYAARDSVGLRNLLGLSASPVEAAAEVTRVENITGSGSMKDDDPVKNFTKTGIGHVLFSASNSDSCKRTLFDNKTGSYKEVADVNCGRGSGDQLVDDKKSEQLQSMRKAFNR